MPTRLLDLRHDLGLDIKCTDPIIDVETSNDISSQFGRWRYEEADICCVGIIADDRIIQVYRGRNDDVAEFKEKVVSLVSQYPSLFAFNQTMEHCSLSGYLGTVCAEVMEIKPFKGAWTKDDFYEELVEDGLVDVALPSDPLGGNAALVPHCWVNDKLDKILDHNVVCLLKELLIFRNREYLYDKHSDNIDDDGWYRDPEEWEQSS